MKYAHGLESWVSMRFFENLDEALPFLKAMASDTRLQILKILTNDPNVNLSDLAKRLGITSGALTSHIRILEEAGIIQTKSVVARHGVQKFCTVPVEKYMIHAGWSFPQNSYSVELMPGQYVDYEVTPTCGIATGEKIIGTYDTPMFFSDPEHFSAQVVWFTTGFVEYEIPNYVPERHSISEIVMQAEMSSEAPAYCNDYPSDVHFYINGVFIGIWRSLGDFGGVKGLCNPSWWVLSMNQFGALMEIRINSQGVFVDGIKVSDVTVDDLRLTVKSKIRMRLAVPDGLPDSRGLTIFGRGFGNYNNGMIIRVSYHAEEKEEL